jgi:hypothetical protein
MAINLADLADGEGKWSINAEGAGGFIARKKRNQ